MCTSLLCVVALEAIESKKQKEAFDVSFAIPDCQCFFHLDHEQKP